MPNTAWHDTAKIVIKYLKIDRRIFRMVLEAKTNLALKNYSASCHFENRKNTVHTMHLSDKSRLFIVHLCVRVYFGLSVSVGLFTPTPIPHLSPPLRFPLYLPPPV